MFINKALQQIAAHPILLFVPMPMDIFGIRI